MSVCCPIWLKSCCHLVDKLKTPTEKQIKIGQEIRKNVHMEIKNPYWDLKKTTNKLKDIEFLFETNFWYIYVLFLTLIYSLKSNTGFRPSSANASWELVCSSCLSNSSALMRQIPTTCKLIVLVVCNMWDKECVFTEIPPLYVHVKYVKTEVILYTEAACSKVFNFNPLISFFFLYSNWLLAPCTVMVAYVFHKNVCF